MKSSWLFIYPLPLFSLQIQTRLLSFHWTLPSSLINFLETDIEWEKMKIRGTAEMFFWHLPSQRDINRKVKRREFPKAIHFAPQIRRVSLDLWNNCGRDQVLRKREQVSLIYEITFSRSFRGKLEEAWDPTQITRGSVKTPRFHSIILSVRFNDVERLRSDRDYFFGGWQQCVCPRGGLAPRLEFKSDEILRNCQSQLWHVQVGEIKFC